MGYYDKYIKTGIADFVFSYNTVDDMDAYGYEHVFGNLEYTGAIGEVDMPAYNLYVRNDLL